MPLPVDPRIALAQRRRLLLLAVFSMIQGAYLAVTLYASQWYWRQPYHTSALSGEAWVNKLIYGHPDRIRNCLGMRGHVFLSLIGELRLCGLSDSQYVTMKEKVAIFLYTCVSGLSVRHVGERSRYFKEVFSTRQKKY